ncbi:Lactate racemase [subsurface metagenome]
MKYQNVKIAYGKDTLKFGLPKNNPVDIIIPEVVTPIKDLDMAIKESLKNPYGCEPLSKIINPKSKIIFIVDDNTRPTPTKKIVVPILEFLENKGIPNSNISIIFALGGHRKLNKKEMISILGDEIINNYCVINHEAREIKKQIYLGETAFGTPVYLNKGVYKADLRILIGIIKPHNQAGYTGGGKSILPGVCGIETILSNHSFRSTGHKKSRLGIIKGNPIREDIEEALRKIGPTFIVNLVSDHLGHFGKVFSGDYIKAHRMGVKYLDRLMKKIINKKADICICGTPDPIDINFYQMLNSLSASYRVERPFIKKNGIIIVAGRAHEGISSGNFYAELRRNVNNIHLLWNKIKRSKDFSFNDRPALHIFLEGALKYEILVVSEEKNHKYFREMNIMFYRNIENVVKYAINKKGSFSRIVVLPYAPYLICNYEKEKNVKDNSLTSLIKK